MGQTLWVDSEGRVEDDPLADNSIMLRLDEQLQALAEKLGISKLNVFYNYSVMAKEFGESLPQSWFDPDAPLATVVALRKHLDKHPENLQFAPSAFTTPLADPADGRT